MLAYYSRFLKTKSLQINAVPGLGQEKDKMNISLCHKVKKMQKIRKGERGEGNSSSLAYKQLRSHQVCELKTPGELGSFLSLPPEALPGKIPLVFGG